MKYAITTYGDPVLRKQAEPVQAVTPEIQALAAAMLETMYDDQGLGLAAEQVGRTEALCVIDVPAELQGAVDARLNEAAKMPLVLLNPVVSDPEGAQRSKEGCLSFPDFYMDVTRPRAVTVSFMGLDGKHYELRVHGLLARAVMHEVDHLNGVLFIDYFTSTQKLLSNGKLRRIKAYTSAERNAK